MNISPILQRTISRGALQLRKYSPQILTAVGIGGLITAGSGCFDFELLLA